MPASPSIGRRDIAAPGQHGSSPILTASSVGTGLLRLVILEANRTKAELWHYYSLTNWGLDAAACYHTDLEGIRMVGRLQPDFVFTGPGPKSVNPRDYLGQLRAAAPSAKLIFFSTVCNEYLVHIMRGVDCQGFIYEPDESLGSLTRMIEKVRQGQRTVSPSIARCQAQLRSQPMAFPKLLSARHEEVLVCIAHSMTDEEIARHLGFSAATALSHRQKIMKKLGVHSTPKLIRYCMEKGFNSVPPPKPHGSHKMG